MQAIIETLQNIGIFLLYLAARFAVLLVVLAVLTVVFVAGLAVVRLAQRARRHAMGLTRVDGLAWRPGIYFTDDTSRWSTKPGVAKAVRYNPVVPSPEIPKDLPERDAAAQGQKIYNKQCAPCHGVPGDGKGFLAAGFAVKPRDFRQGTYKFRSTLNGELPTLADVEKTIRIGVPTTTMPAWRHFLTPEEIHNVACYVVAFSPRFVDARKANAKPAMLDVPPVPGDLASLVERGKEFYRINQCAKCHGEEGRGDGPSAPTLKDSWDQPIVPADLTYKWAFKNGDKAGEIAANLVLAVVNPYMCGPGGDLLAMVWQDGVHAYRGVGRSPATLGKLHCPTCRRNRPCAVIAGRTPSGGRRSHAVAPRQRPEEGE